MQELPGAAYAIADTERPVQKVGVFLCRCAKGPRSGLDTGALERFLRQWAPDLLVVVRGDLCGAPQRLGELSARAGVAGAVIPSCAERAGLAHVLRQAGALPWAIETVNFAEIADMPAAAGHITQRLAAAVVRVRGLLRATPDHLKVFYEPQGRTFDRRALLRSLLEPTYQVVPAVEASRCAASQGCRLCLGVCPVGALSLGPASTTLTRETCTACGGCVSTCPSQAITWPGLGLADLDAQLAALLDPAGGSLAPRLLLIACARSAPAHAQVMRDVSAVPLDTVVLSVPCAASISAALLLRAFERGARGVAVLSCPEVCPQGHDRARSRKTVDFATKVLEALGVAAQPLALIEGPLEGSRHVAERLSHLKEGGTARPEIQRPAPGQASRDGQDLSLAAILLRLWAALTPSTPPVISGADVPFGQIRVTEAVSCTLCGVCTQVCPTRALSLIHNPTEEALTFSHARCVACGACVEQCPEKVLQLDRALDFAAMRGAADVLACQHVIRCRRCQQVIASASMLAKVQQSLSSLPGGRLWDPGELCASCRLAGSISTKAEMSVAGGGPVAIPPGSPSDRSAGASEGEM